jgi:hypothetical protein
MTYFVIHVLVFSLFAVYSFVNYLWFIYSFTTFWWFVFICCYLWFIYPFVTYLRLIYLLPICGLCNDNRQFSMYSFEFKVDIIMLQSSRFR